MELLDELPELELPLLLLPDLLEEVPLEELPLEDDPSDDELVPEPEDSIACLTELAKPFFKDMR